jgi:hypothetical protein
MRIYLTPTIAGIAMYNGALRKENQEGHKRSRWSDPESLALKDASGNYIRGNWTPVLKAEDWLAVVSEWTRRREGKTFSAAGTRPGPSFTARASTPPLCCCLRRATSRPGGPPR